MSDIWAVQHLNSKLLYSCCACSLPEEFGPLLKEVADLEWATQAFGTNPEATNLWIGGDDSMTSFHKVSTLAGA